MAILLVVLLVLWAIIAVVGFAFPGLLWLAIVAIILFVGTVVIALLRRNTLAKRSRSSAPVTGSAARRTGSAPPKGPAAAARPTSADTKAPTAKAQENEIVADGKENPASNIE